MNNTDIVVIKNPDDQIRAVAWWPTYPKNIDSMKHAAWMQFFGGVQTNVPYKLPLAEARQAYEGIGYRAVHYKLVEVNSEDE